MNRNKFIPKLICMKKIFLLSFILGIGLTGLVLPAEMQIPARKVVVGNPARQIREVRDEELL